MGKRRIQEVPPLEERKASYRNAHSIGDREEEAKWANQIGHAYKDRGEYVTALEWFRKDFEYSSTASSSEPAKLMPSLLSLGEIYLRLERYDDALKYQHQHFQLAEQIGDVIEQQRSTTQLGRTYLDLYDVTDRLSAVTDAQIYFQKSLDLVQRLRNCPPDGKPSSAFVLEQVDAYNNLGLVKSSCEDYDGAFEFYFKGLKLCDDEEIGENDAARSRLHHNLGLLYIKLRDFEKANFHTRTDIRICERIPHRQGEAKGLINLAELYLKSRDFEGATGCYVKALEIAQKLQDEDALCAQIKSNMQVILEAKAKAKTFDEGMQQLSRLGRESKSLKGKLSERHYAKQECKLLTSLAGQAEELQAWDVHYGLAKRVKKLCVQLGDSEKLGDALELVASSYYNRRNFKKAIKWHRKSFELCKRINHLEGQIVAKINYGNSLDGDGRPEDALKAYEEALEAATSHGSGNLIEQRKRALENIHFCYLVKLNKADKAMKIEHQLEQLKHEFSIPRISDDEERCSETGSEASEDAAGRDEESDGADCIFVLGSRQAPREPNQSRLKKTPCRTHRGPTIKRRRNSMERQPCSPSGNAYEREATTFHARIGQRRRGRNRVVSDEEIDMRSTRELDEAKGREESYLAVDSDSDILLADMVEIKGKKRVRFCSKQERRKHECSSSDGDSQSLSQMQHKFPRKTRKLTSPVSKLPSSAAPSRSPPRDHFNESPMWNNEGAVSPGVQPPPQTVDVSEHAAQDCAEAPLATRSSNLEISSSGREVSGTVPNTSQNISRSTSVKCLPPATRSTCLEVPNSGRDALGGVCSSKPITRKTNDPSLSAADVAGLDTSILVGDASLEPHIKEPDRNMTVDAGRVSNLSQNISGSTAERCHSDGEPSHLPKINPYEPLYVEPKEVINNIGATAVTARTSQNVDVSGHGTKLPGGASRNRSNLAAEGLMGSAGVSPENPQLDNLDEQTPAGRPPLLTSFMTICKRSLSGTSPNPSVVERLRSQKVSEEVIVAGCNMKDNDAFLLLAALKETEAFSVLDMSHNSLGNVTVHAIQELVKSTDQSDLGLTLDLHCNNLGAGALLQICRCPMSLSRIEILNLAKNRLTDAAARHLSRIIESQALATLNLESCSLTTRSIKQLAAALRPESSLAKLCIGRNNPIAGFAVEELLDKLSKLTSFFELDLRGIELDKHGVASIGTLLQKSTSLSVLILQATNIHNDAALALANSLESCTPRLVTLDLSLNSFSGKPAVELYSRVLSIQNLSVLNLSGNEIAREAAQRIGQSLAQSTCRLKTLDLSKCFLGPSGILLILRSVREQASVVELSLADNVRTSRLESSTPFDASILECERVDGSRAGVSTFLEQNLRTGQDNEREKYSKTEADSGYTLAPSIYTVSEQVELISTKEVLPSTSLHKETRVCWADQFLSREAADVNSERKETCHSADGSQRPASTGNCGPDGQPAPLRPEIFPGLGTQDYGFSISHSQQGNLLNSTTSYCKPVESRQHDSDRVDGIKSIGWDIPADRLWVQDLARTMRTTSTLCKLDLSGNGLRKHDIGILLVGWSSCRRNQPVRHHAEGSQVHFSVDGWPRCPGTHCCDSARL